VVNGGRGIKVYAADKATGDGVIPFPYALIDEPHRHKDLGLYRTWKGKLRKRGAQIVAISTAGEPGTDFEETRDRSATRRPSASTATSAICARRARRGDARVQGAAAEQAKDLRLVRLANPLSVITEADLREKLESPTLDYGEDWLRLTCNIPARSSRAAISDADWDNAQTDEEIPEGATIDLGADFAWSHDTTAIVPLWMPSPEFRLLGAPKILTPPRDGTMLDPQRSRTPSTGSSATTTSSGSWRTRRRRRTRCCGSRTSAASTVVDWPQNLKNEIWSTSGSWRLSAAAHLRTTASGASRG
jgi:hypothetical protein